MAIENNQTAQEELTGDELLAELGLDESDGLGDFLLSGEKDNLEDMTPDLNDPVIIDDNSDVVATQTTTEPTTTTQTDSTPQTTEQANNAEDDFVAQTTALTTSIQSLTEKQEEYIDVLGELGKKLDSGEIGEGEYNAEKTRIDIELGKVSNQLLSKQAQVEQLTENQEQKYQQVQAQFDVAVGEFMAHPENAVFAESTIHQQALQAEINKFVGSNLSASQILDQARQNLSKVFVLQQYANTQQQQPTPTGRPKRDVQPMPSANSIPPVAPNNDDPMSVLNGKSGVDFEAAMFDENIQRRVLR